MLEDVVVPEVGEVVGMQEAAGAMVRLLMRQICPGQIGSKMLDIGMRGKVVGVLDMDRVDGRGVVDGLGFKDSAVASR